MEKSPTELRRSKRLSQNIKKYDWVDLDFSDTESIYGDTESMSSATAKDDLTGRGCVSYIDDVKVLEFETLEDMKLYDSVAEKIGNVCCASFNELYLPFRGFSEEECSSSKTRLLLCKALSKYGSLVENQGSKKVSKPNKKAKSKLKSLSNRITFEGLTICGPHGEESCVLCSAYAKSHNLITRDDGNLLTPSPNASLDCVTDSSMGLADSEFEKNIEEDLLLTPQGSPSSELDPLCSNSLGTLPINLSAIPYIFKCSASPECLSPRACADISSHFTLCVQLTPARGRALSKFAMKCLDRRQECNIVDRVSATIAASAVESSASTIFLPLTNDVVSCVFPKSNLIHYLESPTSMKVGTLTCSPKHSYKSEKLFECSNLEKTLSGDNDIELQYTCTDNLSNILHLSPKNSDDSSNSSNTIKQVKRKQSGSTPGPQKKKPLIDLSTNSNGQQILEMHKENPIALIENDHSLDDSKSTPDMHSPNSLDSIDPLSLGYQEMESESPPSIEKQMSHPRRELNSSPLESGHFALSGSIIATDSFSGKLPNQTDHMNPRIPEPREPSDSGACSLDSLYPRVVSISSLTRFSPSTVKAMQYPKKLYSSSGLFHSNMEKAVIVETDEDDDSSSSSKFCPQIVPTSSSTRFSSSTLHALQPNSKKRGSSSSCPIYSEMRKTVVSEGQTRHSRDVIDLTTCENDTQLYQASAVQTHPKAKKREGLFSSVDQIPEKVIIIDDDPHETDNQLELESGTTNKIRSASRLKKLDSTINQSFTWPVYKVSEVPSPTMHSRNVNRTSNPKVIDLTKCSGYDNQDHSQSGLAKRPTENAKQKVIDLTEGDEEQPPLNVEKISISEQLNVVSDKGDVSNIRSLSKLDQGYNREEVIEDCSVKPCSGLQDLAVMCITVPSLGFIRVIRCQSGELMLNETFTARVYKQFDDLKALNSYLNSRFEKIAGVKDQCPLEWILATAGVIKLKKVRPINPKVWFHPNDYILAKDGSAICLAVPSNLSKAKSSPSKTQSSLINTPIVPQSKLVEITEDETNNIRSSCSKPLPEENRLIPVAISTSATPNKLPVNSKNNRRTDDKTKMGPSYTSKLVRITIGETENRPSFCCKSLAEKDRVFPVEATWNPANTTKQSFNSDDQPRTARLVSVLLNKQDRQELGFNTSRKKQTSSDRPNYQKSFWPQNSKPCGLSKPSVTNSGKVSSVNINLTTQNKPPSSNAVQFIEVPQPVSNLSSNATQSTGSVPSSSVLSMPSKSSKSQNFRIVIASGANQPTKPNARIQNTYLSNSQPAVLTNKQHSQTNQTSPTVRVLKIMDHKSSSSQIINTLMLNNDPTSLPIKTKPSHSSAAASMGRTVVLMTNNKNSHSINQVPLMQTGSITDQLRDKLPGSNSQNLKLIIDSLKAQRCKVNQHQVFYRSNSVQPLSLPNNLVGQPTSQESSNIRESPPEKPLITQPMTGLVESRVNQNIKNHHYKVVPGFQQTSNFQSSIVQKSNNFTQPVVVSTSKSSDQKNILPVSKPLTGGKQFVNANRLCSGVVLNKCVTSQSNTARLNMNPPIRVIPISSNTQGSATGQVNKAHIVTLAKQRILENNNCSSAVIYYPPSEAEHKNMSNVDSSSIIEPRPLKSSGANVTNKPVEFIKSKLPKVVYSEVERGRDNVRPAPLKLHWSALNNPKPS